MSFSLKLKELREKNGYTQRDLAKRLNVSISTVGMWESTSQTPTAKKLIEIAALFNVSVDALLDMKDITSEEFASGMRATKKVSITPIEEDMLNVFRKIGENDGEERQRLLISMAEGMLKG